MNDFDFYLPRDRVRDYARTMRFWVYAVTATINITLFVLDHNWVNIGTAGLLLGALFEGYDSFFWRASATWWRHVAKGRVK